ncbi:MAG TPA: DNA polymerase III subunit alpha [Rubrivivax sp.]|nr:DNA polymerase III subunit alpha [Rubrivivax sp.]
MSFVHLRLHSEYSVVDGMLRIDDAARAARGDGQVALAISDLNNLFGAVQFYQACRAQGIKPIIGVDVWMEPDGGDKQPSRLLLLVQNMQGYLNLCELLARGWTSNAQRTQAWIKWSWLDELNGGLIALSGADAGVVGMALLAGDAPRAQSLARRLAVCFDARFYIELQRAGLPTHEAHVRRAVALAAQLELPVVATHPLQFLQRDDYEAHEARVCIAEGETLANPRRIKRFSEQQYFKTRAEMQALFADLPSALANSLLIAQRCNLQLTLGKPQLPNFPIPQGMAVEDYFRQLSFDGLEQRLRMRYPDAAERERQRPRYAERLEYEIVTILKMGFPGYFLIVSDFIKWALANGCPVGPGRGSGAGSLVAYSLFITGLDPLQYHLLFERFLNPERVSMPDFDIDFCQANRERVIDYVKARYGRDAVSQIATFGTMAAKAALRDVGRVLGMGYGHVDSIAKLVPAPPGKQVTLQRVPAGYDPAKDSTIYARREAPELEQREAAEEEVAELLSLAMRVEGLVRNVGMHAGGVLIAPGKITDFCPLYQQPGSASAVSQFAKDDVEAIGLVKFDFLGLATLTILELAKEFIRARRPQYQDFDYDTLPLDDARVYKLFSDGKTEAVFQFESRGMQGMLREARPTRIEDLFALNAMFRPGPMENIPSFCARKNGKEAIGYPHPLLETVLSETYGIFVYQEQVMQAAQILGGYSLGGADLLRRAMGKKKAEEMAKQREVFRAGALANGIAQAKADEVFDLMEKFAGYGFNKSHAAAYSLLAYHTAWLKVHCGAEFYAANMTVEMDDTDKLKVLLNDAKQFGIGFEPPDVNRGVYRFEPVDDKTVRYGLGAIKGTGQAAIEAIVAAREGSAQAGGGPFRSLFDFCARVDRQRINKRVIEALIKAGAFDKLHADRASLLASVSLALDWADTQAAHADQGGLFDFGHDGEVSHAASTHEPALVAAAAWDVKERLTQEKTALGFFLSGHLFEQNEAELRQFCRTPIAGLADTREPQLLAGIASELRVVNGQRGRVMIFKLDDRSEVIEAVAGEDVIDAHRELLREDELLIVQGRVKLDRFSGGLRLDVAQVWDLAAARARFGRHLAVAVNGAPLPLRELLRQWPARKLHTGQGELQQGLGVVLKLQRAEATAELELGDEARFWPCDEALAHWRSVAHQGQANVVYG